MEENIIVCRTADGDLIAYDSFADAVANAVENSDKDIAEIAITANDNYKYIVTRKIGRKGLLLHDILEDLLGKGTACLGRGAVRVGLVHHHIADYLWIIRRRKADE